jgi:uncharacterized OsmC-like protein
MMINLKSGNTTYKDMTKVLDVIKNICPVLSMLDAKVKLAIEYEISD